MKVEKTMILWGGPESDWYYFSWWNWLEKEDRYWGRFDIYYDGPHRSIGFWFFNISWSTPYTKVEK